MFDRLAEFLVQFNGYTKSNPVLAGIVSLYGLSVLTFTLKNVHVVRSIPLLSSEEIHV